MSLRLNKNILKREEPKPPRISSEAKVWHKIMMIVAPETKLSALAIYGCRNWDRSIFLGNITPTWAVKAHEDIDAHEEEGTKRLEKARK
jgi:hypothetical protein